MRKRSLDAVIVSHLPHVRYLSGFSGSAGFLLVLPRRALLVTDARYTEQATNEVGRNASCFIWSRAPYRELLEDGVIAPGMIVGFQEASTTVAQLEAMKQALKKVKLIGTGNLVRDLTLVKTDDEVASIARAAALADRVYRDALEMVRPGMREDRLAAEMSYRGRLYGSEDDAFDIIVASGTRGALPHGRASSKKIRKGELVTLDFGCTVNGFHSDMTRTFAVGRPTPEARKIYDVVLESEQRGVAAARAGMTNHALDEVCRMIIRDAGYGAEFGHGTGHGLGLDVHEAPGVSYKAEATTLLAGMVVTIEPGIYLPGRLGVRIEDDVLITSTGRRVLTRSPRELIVV